MTRVRLRLGWTLALAVVLAGCAGRAPAPDPRALEFAPVEFHPPKAERVVLPNGMVLYLLEDHELPLVAVQVIVRAGRAWDPPDRIGLAGLAGTVLRIGGTRPLPGDAFDEALERMAASIEVGVDVDSITLGADLLAKDLDRGLELLVDLLRQPAFPDDKLDLARKQALERLRRRNDDPSAVATREFAKAVYGPEHPLARESTAATLERITRADLVEFHRRFFGPNAVMLGITGDFSSAAVRARFEALFRDWPAVAPPAPTLAPASEASATAVHLVQKEVNQTQIRIGHLGIRRGDPDYFALALLNDVLGGGGFRSRLFQEIRTRRGLAYSAGSALAVESLDRGLFLTYSATRADATVQAIEAMREQIARLRAQPIAPDELALAKDAFLNSFVFSFASGAQILVRQMTLEYYGLPVDFLERYRERILTLTADDLQDVARRYLRPDALVILAVGDAGAFDRPLSELGPVRTIPLEPTEASRL